MLAIQGDADFSNMRTSKLRALIRAWLGRRPAPRLRLLAATLLITSTFFLAAPAMGRDIFVDNAAGDDLNDGLNPRSRQGSGPVFSLRKALLVALPGDRIVMANSGIPYRESIALSTRFHCGHAASPFVIDGQGATLDGSRRVPPEAWEIFDGPVFRFQPPKMAFQQLFINAQPVTRLPAPADQPLPKLQPLEWCLYRGHVYFCVEQDKLPGGYPLEYADLQTGITLYHVHDVAVVNLTVQGFQLDGVNAHDGVRNIQLGNLTCRGNGRSGITVAGSSNVEIDSCLLGNNGAAQLRTEGLSLVNVVDSQLLPNTAPAIEWVGGRLFVDGLRYPDQPPAAGDL